MSVACRKASSAAYSPLPWQDVFPQTLSLTPKAEPYTHFAHHAYYKPPKADGSPLFVLIHGAGATGLTFAALVRSVARSLPGAGFLAPDLRGHGETWLLKYAHGPDLGSREYDADGVLEMGLDRLVQDMEAVLVALQEHEQWKELPGLVLIGHSLGGAVATRVAESAAFKNKVLGLVVLDVVEGKSPRLTLNSLAKTMTYTTVARLNPLNSLGCRCTL